jgi:NitT/TauT family transport system permease protein
MRCPICSPEFAFRPASVSLAALLERHLRGATPRGEGGLGYAIIYASNQMETAYLFALVVAAMALGFSYFFIVMFFEWLALHRWHE